MSLSYTVIILIYFRPAFSSYLKQFTKRKGRQCLLTTLSFGKLL